MSENQPDDHRWSYEQKRAVAERAHDAEREFCNNANAAAVAASTQTLRALIIINGGAGVAVLAFIGHISGIADGRYADQLGMLTEPLIWFASGVALATAGAALAYIVNYCITASSVYKERSYEHPYIRDTIVSKRWLRAGYVFQTTALVAAATSLAFFVLGMNEIRAVIAILE